MNKYLNFLKENINTDNYEIKKSDIHGNGSFSKRNFREGDFINNAIIGTGHQTTKLDSDFKTTTFGTYLNHSNRPNAITKFEDGVYKTYAIIDIKPNEEITVDYTQNEELEQPEKGWK